MKALTIAHTIWRKLLRRKDAYVLLILLGAILVVLVSLNIFGLGETTAYIKDIGLLMAWFFAWILAVTVASRELPQEETNGTIFNLLAKPVTRFDVIAGKWLGCWSVVVFSTLLFYLLVILVTVGKGGTFDTVTMIQGFSNHTGLLAIICAIALAFSTRLNHDAAATMTYVVTTVSFFVVPRVPEFMMRETGFTAGFLMFIYNLFPHFEVLDFRRRMVHGYDPADWIIFGMELCYALVITAIFLVLAWLAYRNKRFTRDSLGE